MGGQRVRTMIDYLRAGVLTTAVILAIQCRTVEPEHPTPVSSDQCEASAAKLAAMGCKETVTPKGTPFAIACRSHADAGLSYPHSCIQASRSCEEMRRCR